MFGRQSPAAGGVSVGQRERRLPDAPLGLTQPLSSSRWSAGYSALADPERVVRHHSQVLDDAVAAWRPA